MSFADAISGIESGGRYGLLGPVTKTGDRAYGKYQVMGSNIGPWTKEVLGVAMTPQQFLSDPKAQDAVFGAKFGQYVSKYGPDGAARAWFAGEKGMNNPNAKDQLGTSVADYAKKFDTALGQSPPISGPQQPNAPIQSPQGAPQTPTQMPTMAPNSGVVGQSPYANMALTGGDGMPIGGLPTQSPMPPLSGPRPINYAPLQWVLNNLPAAVRGYSFLG